MKRKTSYFKVWDLLIYFLLITFFVVLSFKIGEFADVKAANAEIYVDSKLEYVYPLQQDKKEFFVDTPIGGVDVELKDFMIRVTSSNSPLKLCVKQGWIESPGQMIIGIPDRLIIKIVGKSNEEELDSVLR